MRVRALAAATALCAWLVESSNVKSVCLNNENEKRKVKMEWWSNGGDLTGLLKETLPLSTNVIVRTPHASKARAILQPSVPAPSDWR